MKYYPAFIRLAGRPCLVIGGGEVAAQKVASLAAADALVTIISPELRTDLASAAAAGQLVHVARAYAPGDVNGFALVIAATDDEEVQRAVAAEAMAAGILVNIVDRTALCSFIVPAIFERGDLLIAISTSGQSPAMARRIRLELSNRFGPEYAAALQLLGKLREHLTQAAVSLDDRKRILTALVDSSLLEYVHDGDASKVDSLLADAVGGNVSLRRLGVELT